jgi:hypothetical protein
MRNRLLSYAAFAFAMVLGATPSRAAAVHDSSHFKGLGASAEWLVIDATGCIVTNTFVIAADNHTNDALATDGPFADVALFVFDQCHFTEIMAAEAVVDLGAGDFRSSNSLNAATLSLDVQLFDQVSSTNVPATLALAWSGVGDIRRETSFLHTRVGGSSFRSRSSGSRREATVTGTFLVGGTNYAAEPAEFADLSSLNSGTATIQ